MLPLQKDTIGTPLQNSMRCFNCKSCFARENTPRLDATRWYHASRNGVLWSSNKLDGNITILLTLNFLNYIFDHSIHFAPSFGYKIEGESHEMDFAVMSSERMLGGGVDMIFGESKSGAALKPDERRKLKSFG